LPEFAGRAAIYYTPERDDPLWRLGCRWLGRDPETGEVLAQPKCVAAFTASPARYGFHATLKPPMRLAGGFDAFLAGVKELASSLQPFDMPGLEVRQIGRFTALCLASRSVAFEDLADRCVESLDSHRAPEDEVLRQRRAAGRTPRQILNIERWGYPLVFEDWQFHMTLSDAHKTAVLLAPARAFFADALLRPRTVRSICIFVETAAGGDFRLTHRISLG
jgi:hypothetical protein